jgi:hypothetical protein
MELAAAVRALLVELVEAGIGIRLENTAAALEIWTSCSWA